MSPLPPLPSQAFRVWYSIVVLDTTGYVIFFLISTLSLRLLWRARTRATTMGRRLLLPYTAIMLVLGVTIFGLELSAISVALRLSATGRSFMGLIPGVPIATEIWINVLGQVATLLNDALLLYRVYVIAIRKLRVMVLPTILWIASLVLVVVQNSVVLTITPGVPPPPYTLSITLAWLATIIALNMTLTGTIVLLLWPARRVAGSVITIVAESAAGYTAITVIYVAMTAANNPYGTLLLQLFGIGAFLSSSVITFRIARGIEHVPVATLSLSPNTSSSRGSYSGVGQHANVERTSGKVVVLAELPQPIEEP